MLVIKQRDCLRLKAAAAHGADLHEIHACKHRVIHFKDPAVLTLFAQQVTVRAYVDSRVRHDFLSQRIDRRIRDLGELLLEEPIKQRIIVRERRNGNVMTHGYRRLCTVFCSFKDVGFHFLVAVSEYFIQSVALCLRVDRYFVIRDRQIAKMDKVAVQPLAVRPRGRICLFALIVGDDPSPAGIHKKHLTRRQPGFLYDMIRRDVKNSHLRGEDQAVIVRDIVSRRAKAVPVQCRAEQFAVCKENGSRSVPRLHHGRVVVIKILSGFAHEAVIFPRLRDQSHHCKWQIHSVHVEELQCIVQHGGIGPAG